MQKYKSNITSTTGAAIRNVPVTVLTEAGELACLFLDRAGAIAAPNPLATDSSGNFYFYAVNGRYSLRTTVDGVVITDDDVVLMNDPEELATAGPIADAVRAAQVAAARAEDAVEDSGIPDLVATAQNAVVDASEALVAANLAASSAGAAKDQAALAKDAAEQAKIDALSARDAAEAALLEMEGDIAAAASSAVTAATSAAIDAKHAAQQAQSEAQGSESAARGYAESINPANFYPKTGGVISGPVRLGPNGQVSYQIIFDADGYTPSIRANKTNSAIEFANGAGNAINFSVSDAGHATFRGGGTFGARPTWAGVTPWDSGNFNPNSKPNAENIIQVGITGVSQDIPFMRRSDNYVMRLQPWYQELDQTFFNYGSIGRGWTNGSGFLSITIGGVGFSVAVSASDLRLKRDIASVAVSGIDKINRIELCQFRYKEGSMFDSDAVHEIGFKAQQLYEIDPCFVNGDPNGEMMMSPNVAELVATLTKAVQELDARVKLLESLQ